MTQRPRARVPLRTLFFLAAAVAFGVNPAAHAAASGSRVVLLSAPDVCGYCAAYNNAARAAAKERGIQLEVVTNKFDAAQQAAQVDQAIASKPDAIILWPIDENALVPSIRKIKAAGIPLVVSDGKPDFKHEANWLAWSGPDDLAQGRLAARLMVTAFRERGLGDSGEIFTITGAPGTSPAILRKRGFEEELAKLAPNIRIVASQPGNWDQGVAAEAAAGLFTRHGKTIKGVFAHEDVMMAGVVAAAERAGFDPGKLALVGFGCEPVGVQMLKNGSMHSTIEQSPLLDGRYPVENIANVLDKKPVERVRILPSPAITRANVSSCTPWQ